MFDRRLARILIVVGALYALFLARVLWIQAGGAEEARQAALGRRMDTLLVQPRRGTILDADGVRLASDEPGYDLLAEARGLGAREWCCEGCGRVVVTYERAPSFEAADAGAREVPAAPPPPCCGEWADGDEDRRSLAPLLGMKPGDLDRVLDLARSEAWAAGLAPADAKGEAYSSRRRRFHLEEALARRRKVLADIPRAAALEVVLRPRVYRGLTVEVDPVRRRGPGLDPATAAIVGRTGPADRDDVERLQAEGFSPAAIYRMDVGRTGVERAFDGVLSGRFGTLRIERDRFGGVAHAVADEEARDGGDLRLLVSSRLDAAADRILDGRPGAIVLLRASDGGILAMAGKTVEGLPGAISGVTPGSVLKVLTGFAALEAGVAPSAGEVRCLAQRSRPVPCEHLHTDTSFRGALSGSCNAYFAEAARRLGVERLREAAVRLRIDEPYEVGVYPEGGGTAWSQRVYRDPWDATDLANLGVGQSVALSPLQVGGMLCAVANGGRPVRPHLVDLPVPLAETVISLAALGELRRGLEDTVLVGTAARAGLRRGFVAGKTGTAQTGKGKDRLHAWFAGYAPVADPEVVVVVVLQEQPLSGGAAAAPLAGRMLEEWERWAHRR